MTTKMKKLLTQFAAISIECDRRGDDVLRRQAERNWAEAGGAWGVNQKGRMLWRKADGALTVHYGVALLSWVEPFLCQLVTREE